MLAHTIKPSLVPLSTFGRSNSPSVAVRLVQPERKLSKLQSTGSNAIPLNYSLKTAYSCYPIW